VTRHSAVGVGQVAGSLQTNFAPCSRGRPPRAQGDVGDVPLVIRVAAVARADPDLLDVAGVRHDALADQEARGQIEVVAGGPHGQREGLAADPDAQRLLGGQQVGPAVPGGGLAIGGQADAQHPAPGRPSGHSATPVIAVASCPPR